MNTYLIVGIIILVILLIWYIGTYNEFLQTEEKVEESYSGIDAALERRYDAVKQCFAAAKNYVDHEQQVIIESAQYRSGMSPKELSELNEKIDKSVSTINAVAESFPDLKAASLFSNLQATIVDTEEGLQASRRLYNSNVTRYNQLVVSFPSNIIAKMLHYQKKEFFKMTEGKAKGFEIPM